MTETQKRALKAKEVLARAVAEVLERKRRLGQYAVVYRDGRIVRIEPERQNPSEHA